MFALVGINPGKFVEVLQFARNLHRNVFGIEARDPPYPALAIQKGAAKRGVAVAIRTERAHPGDHYSAWHRSSIVYGCLRHALVTRWWDNGLCPSVSIFQSRFARANAATATLPQACSRASTCRATSTALAQISPALKNWSKPRRLPSSAK